jgi:RimJ/RimL family protein N-acetyltransferase
MSSDAEAFMTWGGDSEVTWSLFWDHYTDVEVARNFLRDVAEKHPWFMAICLDGAPVGAITLDKGKFRASVRAEIGYVISKAHWGQGVTTTAVKLALKKGFKDLDVQRIEALVDPENISSIKVLEKSGFQKEGILKKYVVHRGRIRDRYIFSVTL